MQQGQQMNPPAVPQAPNPDPTRNNSNVQPGGYYQPNDQFQLTPEQEQRRNEIYGTTQPQSAPTGRGPQPRSITVEMDDGSRMIYDPGAKRWSFA
jgi:hypothetical protein